MWRAARAALRASGVPLQTWRPIFTSSLFSQKAATLTVTPKTGLADKRPDVKAEGLGSGERVTLRVSGVRHRGCPFHSLVHYEVDSGEGLALARDLALGGDFTGVGPMGLLWSLMPAASKDPCLSRMPRAALKNPLKVEVTVHLTPLQ
ncbi:acyl-coenzyme A thioesterase 2, mitochondrial-like [Papio anubis]|uniref:acyl-coenzyme A thioesterase 2, mitochondrial-like n=1 Tax=Papio anubis TaxID=9555 RepID=UPI0004F1FDDE|nr:acyl-coenzyme A thioesterase 2, mitochondrial-like [Papio anubis]XP_017816844.1 acyl-coenzyme A thioesterase 2, mitochondrial-like [Papio anubis]